ncbi:uncharacterized protein TNIN_78881 [Trichonephila inaurata madagascariensis]|uniref:Uncharacterized protein n=1 Tax=Trichonephila inaurata madagascariensis TaxID=2747483 RepID=A0A8X6XZG9_9ARAC|nr:uncharacterized protein TNIN_78881 [Trichonephila inaurata madagascariensis]
MERGERVLFEKEWGDETRLLQKLHQERGGKIVCLYTCAESIDYRRIPIFSKTHPFKIPNNPPQSAKKHTLQNRDHFRLIPGGPFQVKPDAIDSESSCIDYCTQTDQIANSRPIQTFTPQMIPRLMTPDWLGRDDGQTRVLGNPNGLNFLEVRTFHCTESETAERRWKMVIYVLSSFEIWIEQES